MSRKTGLYKLAVLIGAIVLVIGWIIIQFMSDSPHIQPGSVRFYLLVRSTLIRKCPQLSAVSGSIEYFYSPNDGPARRSCGITYLSSADSNSMMKSIDNYLIQQGYIPAERRKTEDGFSSDYRRQNTVTSATCNISTVGDATRVVVYDLQDE